MESSLAHIQINIRTENVAFYKELMSLLGWSTLYEGGGMLGVGGKDGASLWFGGPAKDAANDHDGPGVNHLGLGAQSQADVDSLVAWLRERGVACLFETPRHRPEFAASESATYYQVMFETPDRPLMEFVYTGPK